MPPEALVLGTWMLIMVLWEGAQPRWLQLHQWIDPLMDWDHVALVGGGGV